MKKNKSKKTIEALSTSSKCTQLLKIEKKQLKGGASTIIIEDTETL